MFRLSLAASRLIAPNSGIRITPCAEIGTGYVDNIRPEIDNASGTCRAAFISATLS